MTPTCDTCRFFDRRLFATGPCLRHAPVIDERSYRLTVAGETSSRWPWVNKRDRCGDYEKRETE